jgi:DNA-directed RNA polymerase subunit RPC12/RpoP
MKCPACGSARVYPSHLRGAVERLRQMLTDKQPYRCHECGRRKWAAVELGSDGPDVHPQDLRTGRAQRPVSPAELDRLDRAATDGR